MQSAIKHSNRSITTSINLNKTSQKLKIWITYRKKQNNRFTFSLPPNRLLRGKGDAKAMENLSKHFFYVAFPSTYTTTTIFIWLFSHSAKNLIDTSTRTRHHHSSIKHYKFFFDFSELRNGNGGANTIILDRNTRINIIYEHKPLRRITYDANYLIN